MAAQSSRKEKRSLEESRSDADDRHNQRPGKRCSFASVVQKVMGRNHLEKILEPMLRKVVSEEMERAVTHCPVSRLSRSPSFRIQAPEPSSSLHLIITKTLKGPIFTLNRLVSFDGSPFQVHLVDPRTGQTVPLAALPNCSAIEIVVLHGDFPAEDRITWSPEEFKDSILKEREGKRPLIAGKRTVTVKATGGGADAAEFPDLQFTDNSSWTRSGKFRLGAQIVVEGHPGNYEGSRIREAVSEAFVVRDHRGEPYKKHYPPKLEDEVWRLEKIGKGGPNHRSLSSKGVYTVQDLLKMSVVHPDTLKTILGRKMTPRKWNAMMGHANKCEMGSKYYSYVVPDQEYFDIVLDPICRLVGAYINGQAYSREQLTQFLNISEDYIGCVAREAYSNWNSLQEVAWSLD